MTFTRRTLALLATVLLTAGALKAQQYDPVVIEVGGQQITRSQFMAEFDNSVGSRMTARTTAAERRKAMDEYLDLYATFRAKMLDAHAQGFDTTPTLRREMAKYRKELAAPYLIDSSALNRIMRTAYERNHYSLRAAHILVRVTPDAAPEDTLKAWKHIVDLRQRIAGGEDFYAVAREEALATGAVKDSSLLRPNEGDLGWFTAFDMVHPFEDAAYALKVGELSQPVRSRFGYHIIKLLGKIPMQGKLDVAHIWIGTSDSAALRPRVYTYYKQIMSGTPFEMLARTVSDDRTTRNNGGLMPNATLNNLPIEYVERLATMKPGDVSAPFFTQYGWHIIKLVHVDTLAPLADMESFYKQRLVRDQRGDVSRKAFAKNCRVKYGVVDYTTVPADRKGKKMKASLDELIANLPDSVFRAKWDGSTDWMTDFRPLVNIAGHEYNSRDLAAYIAKNQKGQRREEKDYYVKRAYENFVDSMVIVYADSQLEKEHQDLADLLEDYRRGLMIFDYNEKLIWAKAINDTAGFADYYRRASRTKSLTNPADTVFFWNERARVSVIDLADSTMLSRKKVKKLIDKAWKRGAGSSEMVEMLDKAYNKRNKEGKLPVQYYVDVVERNHQSLLAADQWQPGVYITNREAGYRIVVVDEVMAPTLKAQLEARGYYLNEYQNELERELNESLRAKYNVKIYRERL